MSTPAPKTNEMQDLLPASPKASRLIFSLLLTFNFNWARCHPQQSCIYFEIGNKQELLFSKYVIMTVMLFHAYMVAIVK